MRNTLFAFALFVTALCFGSEPLHAQSWQTKGVSVALKSGETTEVQDLYWVINCQSQLLEKPEATIMEGPPGVSLSVAEAMVLPRFQQCPKAIKGAKLFMTAQKIEEQSSSVMTVRLKYKTKDGPREQALNFTISLFP